MFFMKKVFDYNYFPTKAEEEAAAASNIPYQPTRMLVEIRDDLYPLQQRDPRNPWQIRKMLTSKDVMTGMISLSHDDMFDHVFRYWTLDMAIHVVMGNKYFVNIAWDVNEDDASPIKYFEKVYVQNGPDDTYFIIGCVAVFRNLNISPGDEIGLYWDFNIGSFQFKVFT